ncbi:MAG: hypothetical protein VB122_07960 [Erysipelotrichales bacterium]|nr:hypothetical protein [Erysipelotrichales bacterium]
MIISGILMTNGENVYGHKTKIEELIVVAEQSKGKPLYSHHEPWKKNIGKIIDTRIIYRDDLDCLAVEADIEIDNSENGDEIIHLLKSGGFSSTYSDGGFEVDKSDGMVMPHLEIYFDAYRTNETKLYLEATELSKLFNIGIRCIRVRRHAAGTVLAFVGATIGSYFLNKVLEDINVYGKFKKFLIGTSKSSESGKEVNLNIIASTETRIKQNRISYHVIGQDSDIDDALDYLKENNIIQMELESFTSKSKDINHLYYEVKKENGQTIIKKTRSIDSQNRINYFC